MQRRKISSAKIAHCRTEDPRKNLLSAQELLLSARLLVCLFHSLYPGNGAYQQPGGRLTITSSDPFDPPLIDPGILTAPIDMIFAREAIRSSRRFFAAHAWDGYVLEESPATINATTDDEIDAVIRRSAGTAWHPVSTTAMSAKGAMHGVVDPDLKVKNVEGLRIVDASVMVSPKLVHGRVSDIRLCEAVHYCWSHADTSVCDCREGFGLDQARLDKVRPTSWGRIKERNIST